jgi:ketosteroid isomerase-like protein
VTARRAFLLVAAVVSVSQIGTARVAHGDDSTCRTTNAAAAARARAVAEGIIAADNARALDRVMSFYHPGATLWPPDGPPVSGAEAIRPRYESLFATHTPLLAVAIDGVCGTDSMATVRGQISGWFVSRGSAPDRQVSDRFLMVLTKDARETWRISDLAWRPVP